MAPLLLKKEPVGLRRLGRSSGYGVLLFPILLLVGSHCGAAELITNENSRLQVLHRIFPGATVTDLPTTTKEKPFAITDPWNRTVAVLRDVLGEERPYGVVGTVKKNEEGPASDVLHLTNAPSDKRRVKMRLYRWRTPSDAQLVAVLSYSFPRANPPRCCRAMGKIVLLSSDAEHVLYTFDKVPYAFTQFTVIQFLDSDGTGAEKLLIGGDFSYVATIGVSTAVFDLSQHKINPALSMTTAVLYEADLDEADVHALILDEQRTRAAKGQRFVFQQRTFVDHGKVLRTPATRSVSFAPGDGIPLDWY